MAELKHCAHQCVLTSPEIVTNGICNICFEDKPVVFACDHCNFDLCITCSHLTHKLWRDFHKNNPFEFCIREIQSKDATYMLCSACGDLFSGSFYYKCKECEVYLDLGCATLRDIETTSWDAQETLHYSHTHLVRRCKPGPDARGSCLMCEYPITPSAICYGCVQCYSFIHERCLNLPREIRHPVHPAHPLTRLDFTHTCGPGKDCNACGLHIDGAPLGCPECNFNLHVSCADSLLRGLMHKSHEHRLFYVVPDRHLNIYGVDKPCQICMVTNRESLDPYYKYVECDLRFDFECLEIPKSVFKKAHHIHPLFCKIFLTEDNSMEYCDICETIVHAGHHVYSCKYCDFLCHIECIINEEEPSPLYLKELYSCGGNVTRPADEEDDSKTIELENKIVVIDILHNHVLTSGHVDKYVTICMICGGIIHDSFWKCEACPSSCAHDSCVELTGKTNYRFHLDHPLTLLPHYPVGATSMNCDTCKREIYSFNLFCRTCNFIICVSCAVKFLGELQRGQKFIRYEEGKCLRGGHALVQVMVSISYQVACTICNGRLYGNVVSCTACDDIYHSRCIELKRRRQELTGHPLHSEHRLGIKRIFRPECTACKLKIQEYAYFCSICPISFHCKCIEAVGVSKKVEKHKHYLYHFWSDLPRPCTVCNQPCGASFYGCVSCGFTAHVECTGFPTYVKNQRHQHVVMAKSISYTKDCSLCRRDIKHTVDSFHYTCYHCKKFFHMKCIMSTDNRWEAPEEQINDIYLMHIEQYLFNLLKSQRVFLGDTDSDEED